MRLVRLVSLAAIAWALACGPQRVARGPSPQELAWERAHDLEERGQDTEALAAYRKVCDSGYDRGCLSEIRLLFDKDEQVTALGRVFLFFQRYPKSPQGSSMVDETARFFSRHGRFDEGLRFLGRLGDATLGLEAHDTVLYRSAFLARGMGDPERERVELEGLVALYGRWDSQLWDDAVWRLVRIAQARGDTKTQERWLMVMLDAQETSLFIGSYDSPYHDDALLMLGRLRARRGDLQGALELFYELAEIEKSRLRDDALFRAMEVSARAGAVDEACDAARRLLEDAPMSRFVPEVRRFVGANNCKP